jgi:hypothetical protein
MSTRRSLLVRHVDSDAAVASGAATHRSLLVRHVDSDAAVASGVSTLA